MYKLAAFLSASFLSTSQAHTAAEWADRTIYQVLTDRLAKDTSSSTACSDLSVYCGGTWSGLEVSLYI
jgi:alpha-amylase